MLDQRPEVRDHALAAVALRRGHDHMGALGPGREAGHQLAVHMKERQAAEDRLPGPKRSSLKHVIAQASNASEKRVRRAISARRSCRRCRNTRRCPRASARRRRARRLAPSPIRAENRARERKARSSRAERTSGAPALHPRTRRAPCRRRAPRAGWRARPGGRRLPPEVGPGRRGEGDQKLRLDRLEECGKCSPQGAADREGDPRGLAAPDREMRFGKVRQDEGDRVAALDPSRRKRLPAWVMRRNSSRCDQTVVLELARLSEKGERGRVRRDSAPARSMAYGVAGMFLSASGARSMASTSS